VVNRTWGSDEICLAVACASGQQLLSVIALSTGWQDHLLHTSAHPESMCFCAKSPLSHQFAALLHRAVDVRGTLGSLGARGKGVRALVCEREGRAGPFTSAGCWPKPQQRDLTRLTSPTSALENVYV
jgi:hypothetical protein